MTRPAHVGALLAAAPLALLLCGCPLPQSVPTYPTTGRIAPPRILADGATPSDTIYLVKLGCGPDANGPTITLAAELVDENTLEADEARWFVDYLPDGGARSTVQWGPQILAAPADGITTVRTIPPFAFRPYTYDAPGAPELRGLHVVELVVSNGFEPADNTGARPNRATKPNFETQVFRWVFQYTDRADVACPP